MSRSRKHTRAGRELRAARAIVDDEFEPLWRCAASVPHRPGLSELERENLKAAAKATALAWLGAMLGRELKSVDELEDLEQLRRAFLIVRRVTILDVRRWAEARGALIEFEPRLV